MNAILIKKRVVLGSITFLVVVIAIYASLVWHHNRPALAITPSEYSTALEKGIRWLTTHRTEVLADNNAMLWWMIMKSANLTGDQRLHQLLADYKQRYIAEKPGNIWRTLFEEGSPSQIRVSDLRHLPDYNVFIIYGLTCNDLLRDEEIIQQQMEEYFCLRHHPISPACATHQLMGVLFARTNKCMKPERMDSLVVRLQEKIESELFWDPRVVDVHIQRALMLAETGAQLRLKTTWIRNVLDAQEEDGGWDDFHPQIPIGDSSYLGFTGRGLGVRSVQSDFHATAQGILLVSLLASNQARSH